MWGKGETCRLGRNVWNFYFSGNKSHVNPSSTTRQNLILSSWLRPVKILYLCPVVLADMDIIIVLNYMKHSIQFFSFLVSLIVLLMFLIFLKLADEAWLLLYFLVKKDREILFFFYWNIQNLLNCRKTPVMYNMSSNSVFYYCSIKLDFEADPKGRSQINRCWQQN